MRKTWRERLRAALADPRRRELSLHAAAGAYCFFLSLGPLTALLLALLPFTPLTEETLLDGLLGGMPPVLRRLVRGIVMDVYAGSGAALGVSLALELWSGGRFLAAVRRGIEAMRGRRGAGYLRRRLRAAAGTAALAALLMGDLVLLRYGASLLYAARLRAPGADGLWTALMRLRPLLLWLGLTAGELLLYRPGALRLTLGAAALTAGAQLAFSRLYALALERLGLFGVYGSIAAAAATMYWMYGALYLLFAGAWLTAAVRDID